MPRQKPVLFQAFVSFLSASSHDKPAPSNKTPIIKKSEPVQFTSSINCMATNGIRSKIATPIKINLSRVYFFKIVK